jgi:membrane-bound lytic murein transglycosylase B
MAQGGVESEQNITNPPPASQQSSSEQAQIQGSATSQRSASEMRSQTASSQPVNMSRGELRQVQQKLNEMGYDAGKVDGIWGPNTQAAVRSFQHAKGLQATGTLDEQTADALGVDAGK